MEAGRHSFCRGFPWQIPQIQAALLGRDGYGDCLIADRALATGEGQGVPFIRSIR
jgi:hypothetical protein